MANLPTELWESIALQAARHDLLNLALVSPILLDVSRRALIRSVILDGDGTEIRYEGVLTFMKEQNLAGSVHDLTLRNFKIAMEASAIPFGAMTNLKRLSIYDCPPFCLASAAQNALIYHIETTFKALQSIRIRNTSSCPLPMQFASISGLREITWKQEQTGTLSPALITLLTISRHTVQTLNICIKGQVDHTEDYAQLFSFHFPCLNSLSLGPGHRTLFVDTFPGASDTTNKREIRNAFANFLTENHTIRRLTLPISNVRYQGPQTYLQLTVPPSTSTFLPDLVFLEAHPSLITELARAKASFFQSLKTLSLQKTHNGDTLAVIDAMFHAFSILAKDMGQLPLQHLRLAFTEVFPESQVWDKFMGWMTTSASVFPSLETIFSTIIPAQNIIDFPYFQHLRTISCILSSSHIGRKQAELVVAKCPSLRQFFVKTPFKVFKFIYDEALDYTRISIYPPDYNQGQREDGDGLQDAIGWSDEDDDGEE